MKHYSELLKCHSVPRMELEIICRLHRSYLRNDLIGAMRDEWQIASRCVTLCDLTWLFEIFLLFCSPHARSCSHLNRLSSILDVHKAGKCWCKISSRLCTTFISISMKSFVHNKVHCRCRFPTWTKPTWVSVNFSFDPTVRINVVPFVIFTVTKQSFVSTGFVAYVKKVRRFPVIWLESTRQPVI